MAHHDAGRPARNGSSPSATADDPPPPSARGPALLLTGPDDGTPRPLLHYARRCLAQAGRHVHHLAWPDVKPDVKLDASRAADLVTEAVAGLPKGAVSRLVILAVSDGTLAIPWAAERGVPGFWLAPRLDVPAVRDALALLPPDSLLAGGTADPSWDGEVAAASGLPVLQIDGGDHALEIRADVERSLAAMARVVTAVLETLVPSVREDLTPLRGLPLRHR